MAQDWRTTQTRAELQRALEWINLARELAGEINRFSILETDLFEVELWLHAVIYSLDAGSKIPKLTVR
jgi:hypothetical protein